VRRPAVFFDRDGVINVSPGDGKFVLTWDMFRFARGAATQLRRLRRAGFSLVLITNQSCIGRGMLTLDALHDIHRRMQEALGGSAFDAIYYCPHHPDAGCTCRKPSPALILRACAEHGLDPKASFMVGDLPRDIEMGRAAGCRTVFCGKGAGDSHPDHAAKTLRGAVDWILKPYGLNTKTRSL
jgi:histidinol-phosphate phosphatase family protein